VVAFGGVTVSQRPVIAGASELSRTAPDGPAPVLAAASQQLRAPWAASVAGILFAVLFTAAILVIRGSPLVDADDAELARVFAAGEDVALLVAATYLVPIAGIMFLWFIAVIRDQLGDREDRFFATIFFGSGLLFIALIFATAAVVSAIPLGVRELGLAVPTRSDMTGIRALAYTLLYVFASRAAAVCLVSIATLGWRSGAFPRWFSWTGYAIAVVLLLAVGFWDWVLVLVPAWVAVVSVFVLRRERDRVRRASEVATPS
jgi:hypothetical protein